MNEVATMPVRKTWRVLIMEETVTPLPLPGTLPNTTSKDITTCDISFSLILNFDYEESEYLKETKP